MNFVTVKNRKIAPNKVVCVGRNYVEHIQELNNEIPKSMVLFMKPNSAISDNLSTNGKILHYEGEISFLINDRKISAVGFGLDLTDRILQSELKKSGLPWERAKAFDGAGVFSNFINIKQDDIGKLTLRLYINKELAQIGGVELMIYSPATILEEISSFCTLQDGDIVMSGTPKGVGTFNKGDEFKGEIYMDENLLLSQTWIAS